MNKSAIHKLNDDLGAVWDGRGGVELYQNLDAYTPTKVTGLSDGEIIELWRLFADGCCQVCLDDVPQGHHLCQRCATKEAAKW